jgi:hypothetical protein
MRILSAMLAVLALGSFAALPSEAAPIGPASALKTGTSGSADLQTVNHSWNHHCGWRRGYRYCWWSSRPWYGPSIDFRFGRDRHYYGRRDYWEHRKYYGR